MANYGNECFRGNVLVLHTHTHTHAHKHAHKHTINAHAKTHIDNRYSGFRTPFFYFYRYKLV